MVFLVIENYLSYNILHTFYNYPTICAGSGAVPGDSAADATGQASHDGDAPPAAPQ